MKKPSSRKSKHWHIAGYDSTQVIYEVDVPRAACPESRTHEMLRALACKGLTCREIVEAHAKTKGQNFGSLLEVVP